ncbi:MAG: 4a-hydroxytetrahydrobiopterin dehydratase [archaeon]
MPELSEMHCEKDSRRLFVLEDEDAQELLKQIWQWKLEDDKLIKDFFFPDFVSGIAFVNKIAMIAEQEKYSPKFKLEQKKVEVSLCTEGIDGLIKNDFIIAAKIDNLAKK